MSELVTETCPVCGAVNGAETPKFIRIEWESNTTRIVGASWFKEANLTDDEIMKCWNYTHPSKAIRRICRNLEIPESKKEAQP